MLGRINHFTVVELLLADDGVWALRRVRPNVATVITARPNRTTGPPPIRLVSRIDMIAPTTTTEAITMIPRSSLSDAVCAISVTTVARSPAPG